MATKRMFSKDIVGSDAFQDMPASSQLLYFHLGMEADDDGFIGNPKKISRSIGMAEDDMKILLAKRFVLLFDSGVLVIKHHRINNNWDKYNCKRTVYMEEFSQLYIKDNKAYTRDNTQGILLQSENSLKTVCKGEENKGEEKRIKKNNTSEPKDSRIPEVIKLFEIVNPSYETLFKNKTERSACERLLRKWTMEQIRVVVNVLPDFNANQFSRGKSITPYQMEKNLGFIKAFIDGKKNNQRKVTRV